MGVGLSQLLVGCGGQSQPRLTVRLLSGSVPPQILSEFRKYLNKKKLSASLTFSPETQIQQLFEQLQNWKQQNGQVKPSHLPAWLPLVGDRAQPTIPDLVTLGDYWLDQAIQQSLIQSFHPGSLPGWDSPQLAQWKALVNTSNPGEGKVWGVPYRWGTTVIAYRRDIFRDHGLSVPTDWSDLWRSELRGRISLLDQAREVIGLTLKKLGKSYNTPDLDAVPALQSELQALQPQIKLYSSDAYIQPLLLGDTWLAVGWSTDILPLLQRSPQIAVIVPQSGTALWADVWTHPRHAAPELSPLAMEWLHFGWQERIANQWSLLSRATTPAVMALDRTALSKQLRQNPLLLPDTTILAASEFLRPLPATTVEQYRSLWMHLRHPAVHRPPAG
jgi:putative spermidine/putrescine transport system substrate-binding protein